MKLIILILIITLTLSTAVISKDIPASYWYEKGLMSLNNCSYDEAIASFDSSIAESLKYWDAWYGKGRALYHLKKYSDGLDLCDAVLSDRNGPQGKSRARFIELDGLFYEAYELEYDEPPLKGYELCLGEIPETYRSVEKKFDDALVLDPNLTSAWNSKGILLGTVCRLDESIACFDEALLIDSTAAEVWNNKGVSLDWNGKHNESLRCYDRAIELNPKLAVAWMNRAITLSGNLSLLSLAQTNASQAIKLDPSLENDSLQMAWSYVQAI